MTADFTILQDTLHAIAQALLVPTMAVLIVLIAFVIYQLGSLAVEYFTERRRLRASIPDLLEKIDASDIDALGTVVKASGLLRRHKISLLKLVAGENLPPEARIALAKSLLADDEGHYGKIIAKTDMIARIAPMLGLMGTLIPLAPGLMGLAEGDVQTLSSALLVAFDTTIAGLASSAICYVISKVRQRWYEGYLVLIETLMTAILEKFSLAGAEGDES